MASAGSLVSRLLVGLVLLLVALGGAGLAVAADPPHTGDRRPELTACADREFEPWRARMIEQLIAANVSLAGMALAGREVLTGIYTRDLAGQDAALARGAEDGDGVRTAREALLGVRLELAAELPATRLSRANRDLLSATDEIVVALSEVPGAWDRLAAAARSAAEMVESSGEHDESVAEAFGPPIVEALVVIERARGSVAATLDGPP